ncbi:MAG: hypothetical protein AAFU73_23820 [Planctomycetota bacterium]
MHITTRPPTGPAPFLNRIMRFAHLALAAACTSPIASAQWGDLVASFDPFFYDEVQLMEGTLLPYQKLAQISDVLNFGVNDSQIAGTLISTWTENFAAPYVLNSSFVVFSPDIPTLAIGWEGTTPHEIVGLQGLALFEVDAAPAAPLQGFDPQTFQVYTYACAIGSSEPTVGFAVRINTEHLSDTDYPYDPDLSACAFLPFATYKPGPLSAAEIAEAMSIAANDGFSAPGSFDAWLASHGNEPAFYASSSPHLSQGATAAGSLEECESAASDNLRQTGHLIQDMIGNYDSVANDAVKNHLKNSLQGIGTTMWLGAASGAAASIPAAKAAAVAAAPTGGSAVAFAGAVISGTAGGAAIAGAGQLVVAGNGIGKAVDDAIDDMLDDANSAQCAAFGLYNATMYHCCLTHNPVPVNCDEEWEARNQFIQGTLACQASAQ